jgi:hypothetical protein
VIPSRHFDRLGPSHGAEETSAGLLTYLGELYVRLPRRLENSRSQRVLAVLFDGGDHRQDFLPPERRLVQPLRQRRAHVGEVPVLSNDGADARGLFENGRAPDDDAAFRGPRNGADHRDWYRDQEGTGGGDHHHRQKSDRVPR